ncbi:hypothetical protein F8S20_36660 [Nostoc sp. BAE]|nr:hypothetical protein [Nostoc commune BAE]
MNQSVLLVSITYHLIITWQTKSTKDVSLVMLITFIIGIFSWLIYGIYL